VVPLPARAPGFCSGCPHNRSTVFPDDALVGGGVGCHGIMYFEARHAGMSALPPTPMGAEGVPWIGLAPFVEQPHLIQNLGDGTLSHSGTLAIRASVAAGVNVTYKILYNAAVAMTGGQDVVGLMDVPTMTRALHAEGVSRIEVCAAEPKRYGRRARWAPGVRVHGRDDLDSVQDSLRSQPGVSVIIYDQQCAAEARRLRKRGEQPTPPARVVINESVCEGCGDCSRKRNCLSVQPVQTEFGEKRQIHDPSCNRDYTCLEGDCPSFVTITPTRSRAWSRLPWSRHGRSSLASYSTSGNSGGGKSTGGGVDLPSGDLPLPVKAELGDQFGVYFTGIGGTGVVTANRVIATAAEAAGLVVGGMDQTGLSQKAGAVVSHLHLAADRAALGSAAVTSADLYLSGDLLQAASANHLAKIRRGRTAAIVDGTLTPTASMLQGGAEPPDAATLSAAITEAAGADRTHVIDSQRIAERLLGNHLLANIVLLGAAFQAGSMPLEIGDLEVALKRGREAAANRAAFEWGRWAAHSPEAVEAALAAAQRDEARTATDPSVAALTSARAMVAARALPSELAEQVVRRTAQVIDYQDRRRGERYLDLVASVVARDDADREWALTRAVADAWHKLLTYKDEYEVARLHLATDYDAIARSLGIDGGYKVSYHLHPPALRRMGLKHKLVMGRPYALAFQGLRRLSWVRGTPLDIFGLDRDRRTERKLIEEYAALVGDISDLPYETQVELAASVHSIKGYADIKERAVTAWRTEVARIRACG
jgi:indolepyruvate ferredoxin oxidoreductase